LNFDNKIIWVVTDGSQGMISQVLGLAQNISKKIYNIKTDLLFPWSMLQPGYLPIYKWIFKNEINLSNKPDIIISCGRKSTYFSIYLKKILSNKVITIHIQNPKIKSYRFDFIVAPNHDRIEGNNVIKSIGAIHKFNKQNITMDNTKIKIFKKNIVSIMIGGKNNHYKFSKKIILKLVKQIKLLKEKNTNYNFLIITSRRTGNDINLFLETELSKHAYVWNGKDENPYIFALKNSKFFILTSDSTSMISECAYTGKPLYIYHLPFKRNSYRLQNFHNEFEKMNITKKFLNITKLEEWHYKSLDEAKRISGILKERIIQGSNESK